MQTKKLEIACFNLSSALIAQQAGADRIELCANIFVGGTTPTFEIVKQAREKSTFDLFVMIRPRGGNFVYSNQEFEEMKNTIVQMKEHGVNGFVLGVLKERLIIDSIKCKELVLLASPLPCTFHRAFDETTNYEQALEDVIDCGFKTILTSGQKPTAIEGIEILERLIKQANNRITIMPGGGVRSSNITFLKEKLNTTFFHSSAIIDNSELANHEEINLLKLNLKN